MKQDLIALFSANMSANKMDSIHCYTFLQNIMVESVYYWKTLLYVNIYKFENAEYFH